MRAALLLALLVALAPAARAEEAQANWQRRCSLCHGEAGEGPEEKDAHERIPDFRSRRWQGGRRDSQLRRTISEGVDGTRMRPFKQKLSKQEIAALVGLVRSFASRP
jgi:cytochrome c553